MTPNRWIELTQTAVLIYFTVTELVPTWQVMPAVKADGLMLGVGPAQLVRQRRNCRLLGQAVVELGHFTGRIPQTHRTYVARQQRRAERDLP